MNRGREVGSVQSERVNLEERFGRFDELWSPKIIGSLNDYHIKIAKIKGEFVWHSHEDTDELFLVTKGQLRIRLENHADAELGPGEMFVVPRGVAHCPAADVETHIVMLEPRGTLNTGDSADPTRAATSGEYLV